MSNVEIISDNLSKTFSGKTIFKNLSFKISSGQSLTITGRNGSGKSTLVKIIAGLIQSSKGKISTSENGTEIPKEKWFHKTALLSPYLNLYEELTAFENLDFFYRLKADDKINPREKINSILQRVKLYEKRNELLKNFSSGMKQKLKLAFAVINEPSILLLDEPRTNLDKEGINLIYEISDEQKQRGILIVATNEEKDKELSDKILDIEDFK